jgi:mono/diheme cytochrome c family protein
VRAVRSLTALWSTLAFLAPVATPAGEPQMDYMLNCMGCHTADGHGSPGKVPSLRSTLVPLAADREGRRYLVEVPGVAQSQLSDAAVAELLNWMVRNLAAERTRFVEFSTDEVAHYRAQRLTAVAATRAQILSRIRAAAAGAAAADRHN